MAGDDKKLFFTVQATEGDEVQEVRGRLDKDNVHKKASLMGGVDGICFCFT